MGRVHLNEKSRAGERVASTAGYRFMEIGSESHVKRKKTVEGKEDRAEQSKNK